MKKVLMILVVIFMAFAFSGCYLDVNDTSHDDDYVLVSNYYERVGDTLEVVERYYIPKVDGEIVFYDLDVQSLEVVDNTRQLTYQLRGNYKVESAEALNIYMLSELEWLNIPEIDYIYSESKLQDDVLVNYGTLPVMSSDYEIGDTIRVVYQDSFAHLHFIVARSDTRMFIRYGDIRGLL